MTSSCPKPVRELILHTLLQGLLLEPGVLLPGCVMDAGAFDGMTACFLAGVAPERKLHALEVIAGNVRTAMKAAEKANVTNMDVHGIGLSSKQRSSVLMPTRVGIQQQGAHLLDTKTEVGHMRGRTVVTLERLDALFEEGGVFAGERLALAHWDLEGAELEALKGGQKTLARDQPLFTVETHVLGGASGTGAGLNVTGK